MNKFMKIRLSTWFVLAVVTMVGVTVVVFSKFERLDAQGKGVLRSRTVVNVINDIRSAAMDIESGERGYVITGEITTLDAYYPAIATALEKSDELKKLVEDNPIQLQRAQELHEAIVKKVKIAKSIVV